MKFFVFFNGVYPVRFNKLGTRLLWEVVSLQNATPFDNADRAHEYARSYDVKTYDVQNLNPDLTQI